MPRMEDLRARRVQDDRSAPMEGRISRGFDSDKIVLVTLNAYDHRRQDEAFGAKADQDGTDPAPGDAVWVHRADSGKLIVLTWQTL